MANELMAATDIMSAIDNIMSLPDSIFSAQTGRDILKSVIEQIDINDMAKVQREEFLSQKLGYEQVVVICAKMLDEINDIISNFESMDNLISEKKVFFKQIFGKFNELPKLILADYPRTDATIPVELCHPNAQLPTYAHDGDDGADVYAIQNDEILPRQIKIIPTGIKMAIPRGWAISVRPRSGLSAKTYLRIANTPGTIDANYLAEVGIILENTGTEPIVISTNDRIAQLILERAYKAEFTLTDDVTKHTTENRANAAGEQGFGSTDKS